MGIDNIACVFGVAQLQLLLGHLNKRNRTGQLIQFDRDCVESTVRTGVCLLATPLVTRMPHCPNTWMTSVFKFLHSVGGTIDTNSRRVIPVQGENDHYIMQLTIDSNFSAEAIQQCCLWLQVTTLADVTQTDRQRLETWAYSRSAERR